MNIFTFTKEGILFTASMAMVTVAIASLLAGCAGGGQDKEDRILPTGTMLIDYYRAEKTSGGGYFELVLYTTEDSEMLKLSVYSKDSEDTDENHTDYLVPCEAAENCCKIIEKHQLGSWNGMENAVSADGVLTVCRYCSDGEYIRVSTEEMPENGAEILDSIAEVMSSYAKDGCRIEIEDTEAE